MPISHKQVNTCNTRRKFTKRHHS